MSQNTEIIRRGGVSPLVLRLAVAGVLAYCGARNFRTDDQLVSRPLDNRPSVDQPVGDEQAIAVPETAHQPITVKLPTEGPLADVAEKVAPTAGTEVSFPPNKLLGIAQMNLAFMFAVGLLVRLWAAAGLGSVIAGGLGAAGSLSGYWGADILSDVYASSPAAALLLGAICLALMLSGGGRVGLDRILLSKRRRESDVASTT